MAASGWYHKFNLKAGTQLREKKEILSQVIGGKPQSHQNYEYKTAIWGVSVEDKDCVMYLSQKGLSIEFNLDQLAVEDVVGFYSNLNKELDALAKTYKNSKHDLNQSP